MATVPGATCVAVLVLVLTDCPMHATRTGILACMHVRVRAWLVVHVIWLAAPCSVAHVRRSLLARVCACCRQDAEDQAEAEKELKKALKREGIDLATLKQVVTDALEAGVDEAKPTLRCVLMS